MYRGAIGIIESVGLVSSVEASDAMAKCAEVELLGREDVGGGYHAVCVRGDVGSVRAALEAGARAAERVGVLVGVLLIPRPHDELECVLRGFAPGSGSPNLPPVESLRGMNVHQLRALARNIPGFPLRGRAISHATRDQLLAPLREFLHNTGDAEPPDDRAE